MLYLALHAVQGFTSVPAPVPNGAHAMPDPLPEVLLAAQQAMQAVQQAEQAAQQAKAQQAEQPPVSQAAAPSEAPRLALPAPHKRSPRKPKSPKAVQSQDSLVDGDDKVGAMLLACVPPCLYKLHVELGLPWHLWQPGPRQ